MSVSASLPAPLPSHRGSVSQSALRQRYGGDAPEVDIPANAVLTLLYRHRSVRRFTDTEVDEATLTSIVAAAQSAATSSNQQAWSVIEIRDPERKSAAARLAGDQDFIRQAPVFLVFVADWARNASIASRREEPSYATEYLESTIVGFVDAALAAQNAVVAAESLGLGTVYVGAVRNNPVELSELLGLPEQSFPVVGLAIGHPHPEDAAGVKPRLPQDVVRHRERYAPADDDRIEAYEQTARAYFASQGAQRGWLSAVLGRVRNVKSLHGRESLRTWLAERGLPSR